MNQAIFSLLLFALAGSTVMAQTAQPPRNTSPLPFVSSHTTQEQQDEAARLLERSDQAAVPTNSQPTPYNKDVRTVVFVSASMPSDLIEALYRDAGERSDIIFLLRGWLPPDIAGTLRPFVTAAQRAGSMAATGFDPQAFRTYNIASVPVVLHRCADGHWYRASGTASISRAERSACSAPKANLGALYPITEPDILEVITARAGAMDWDRQVERARERAERAAFATSIALPHRAKPTTRLFDPTVVASQEVRGANQEVLLAEGARINPLDVTTLTRPIIVFNPQSEVELATVDTWRKEHKNAMLLVTTLTLTNGEPVAKRWQTEVWPLHPDLVSRLGLTETPTIIVQHGKQLRLTTQ